MKKEPAPSQGLCLSLSPLYPSSLLHSQVSSIPFIYLPVSLVSCNFHSLFLALLDLLRALQFFLFSFSSCFKLLPNSPPFSLFH